MNERIKQFAKQTLSKDQFGLWLAGDEDIEKFAELIVRECMRVVEDYYMDPCSYADEAIKEHFGVEE